MKKRNVLALAVTIILLGFIFYKIDFYEMFTTLKNFQAKTLLFIIPMYICTLYLRGVRWKALLLDDKKYSSFQLAQVFTVGSMLNAFIPARAGDIYRAFYLGNVKNERKIKVFGSVIMERLFDGIAVFLILLASVYLYTKQPWIINLTYTIGGVFIGALAIIYLILRYNKIDFVTEKLTTLFKNEKIKNFIKKTAELSKTFLDGFEVLKSPKCFNLSFILSLAIWLIEAVVALLIMKGLNLPLGISAGLFAIAMTSFSTVIPSTSVFLGPYQYAYILALGLFHINKTTALAVATLHQAILMAILAIIGGICMLKFNIKVNNK